ncbi:hypothetical protein GGX14DRAFT_579287 [Mycena pura]|uniref:Uncharacterized protein n=1 Tax=Mycena pura TaxID=153505 RepID=A0AAD6UNE2_9AGAR|nr:hypothetical protein GGX14DRAFT_579287 [Mycena pura]
MHSRAALPANELVGEPRLFSISEEQQLLQEAPFAALSEAMVSDLKSGTRTRKKSKLDDWRPGVAQDLSKDQIAMKTITIGCFSALLSNCQTEGAADLFVETIVARHSGREYEALQILIRAQVNAHNGLSEISLRDVMAALDEIKADIGQPITDLKWARSRCTEWNKILRSYFALDSEVIQGCEELLKAVVTVLREMRRVNVGQNKKLTREFQDAVKSSGLCDTLGVLTNPYEFREVNYPYIQLSEGLYHWRISFGAVHDSWTAKECQGPDTSGPYGSGNKEDYMKPRGKLRIPLAAFLAIASDERFVRQATASAENSFFPSSEFNFLFNWVRWIAPTIRAMRVGHNIDVKGWTSQMEDPAIWDIWVLWRDICDVRADGWDTDYNVANPLLRQLLRGAALERAHLKQVKEELLGDYRSPGGRKENSCAPDVRQAFFYKQARRPKDELDQLKGAKLTFAEDGDVLQTDNNLPVFSPAQLARVTSRKISA